MQCCTTALSMIDVLERLMAKEVGKVHDVPPSFSTQTAPNKRSLWHSHRRINQSKEPPISPTPIYTIEIILELPGYGIMNETETSAFEEATTDMISSQTCRCNEVQIKSVRISDQSLSNNSSRLYLWVDIEVESEDIYQAKAKRLITDCIKSNGKDITLNYKQSMGYLEKVPSEIDNVPKQNSGSFWKKNYITISIITGSLLSGFGLLMFGICFVKKRKVRRRDDIQDTSFENDNNISFEEGVQSIQNLEHFNVNPNAFNEDGELGDIEHIMSMVLSGPDSKSEASSTQGMMENTTSEKSKSSNKSRVSVRHLHHFSVVSL